MSKNKFDPGRRLVLTIIFPNGAENKKWKYNTFIGEETKELLMGFTMRPKIILLAGLITGTLDALAAIILLAHMHAKAVFQFIASGLVGREKAYHGGTTMVLLGVAIHYVIAFSFSLFFFWIYPRLYFLRRNVWVSALLYGVFTWLVMNLLVLPLTSIRQTLTLGGSLYNMLILACTIGLPVSFIAKKCSLNQPKQ